MRATSAMIYGTGIMRVPPTVRASVPWGPENYSTGKPATARKPSAPRESLAERNAREVKAEWQAEHAHHNRPLSPREMSELRRRAGTIRMGELD